MPGVVLDLGVFVGDLSVGVFHVRHIYIHYAIEQFQGSQRVVAARIVHQGQTQAGLGGDEHPGDNLGYNVGGRDEIDIVAAHFLELQHHGRQLLRLYLASLPQLTDLIVLTVLAFEVAVGKKDRTRSSPPYQRRFLSKMRVATGNHRPVSCLAPCSFAALSAVDAALPGADVARFQAFVGQLRPAGQFARPKQGQVGRFECAG